MEGADAFKLGWSGQFLDLPDLCGDLESTHAQAHYRGHFDFVDNLVEVTDATTRASVWNEACSRIRAGRLDQLGLSPPELIDWVNNRPELLSVAGAAGPHELDDLTSRGLHRPSECRRAPV